MSPNSNSELPDNLIVRHPPERGARAQQSVVVYSCCCCCCCCLHTVGSVIGAVLGGGFRPQDGPQFDPNYRIPLTHWLFGRLPYTQWLFWSSLAIVLGVSLLATPVYLAVFSNQPLHQAVIQSPLIVGIGFILLGPAFIVGAGVVAALRLAIPRTPPVPASQWWSLGKALLWSFAGGVLGTVVMVVIGVVMSQWN